MTDTPQDRGRAAIAKLPASIRVGPFDIEVVIMAPERAEAVSALGQFSGTEQQFRFHPNPGSAVNAADTVLHEILHAIWWAYGLDQKDDEERIVRITATMMIQAYRDNPWLLAWTAEAMALPVIRNRIDLTGGVKQIVLDGNAEWPTP